MMKAIVRKSFAEGIRARIAGVNGITICPDLRAYKKWAIRALVLAGPVGRLPR